MTSTRCRRSRATFSRAARSRRTRARPRAGSTSSSSGRFSARNDRRFCDGARRPARVFFSRRIGPHFGLAGVPAAHRAGPHHSKAGRRHGLRVPLRAVRMHLGHRVSEDYYCINAAALVVLQPGDALPVGAVPGARVDVRGGAVAGRRRWRRCWGVTELISP